MTTEPIKDKKTLREIAEYWRKLGNLRNYTLIVLGVCSALRISDLLKLTWAAVYDFDTKTFRTHITVKESKTGKTRQIALNKQAIAALRQYLPHRKNEFVFANNRKTPAPLGRTQAWRIVTVAAKAVKAAGRIAAHSLRKTFGFHAYKAGVLPVMLMVLFNHSSFEVTKRYLGIAQEDRDAVYLGLELF